MPKCLHGPCPNQVTDSLYCDEHKYIPDWTTNLSVGESSGGAFGNMPQYLPSPQSAPSAPANPYNVPHAPRRTPVLGLVLLVLILAILAVAVIVILKLIF